MQPFLLKMANLIWASKLITNRNSISLYNNKIVEGLVKGKTHTIFAAFLGVRKLIGRIKPAVDRRMNLARAMSCLDAPLTCTPLAPVPWNVFAKVSICNQQGRRISL